jgi:hypothetical protein
MEDFEERRAAERFPISDHVECTFASPVLEDFGKLRVKNISNSGIGFVVTEPVAPGMLLVVKLENHAKKFSKTILVRVVHVTPQTSGSQLVGGTLDTPLTYEELCALVM